jgi:hypothetical protein
MTEKVAVLQARVDQLEEENAALRESVRTSVGAAATLLNQLLSSLPQGTNEQ